jgi:hypothetical protein
MIASVLVSSVLSFLLTFSAPPASGAIQPETARSTEGGAGSDATSIVVDVTSELGVAGGGAVEGVVRDTVVRCLQGQGLSPAESGGARLTVHIGWVDDARDGYALRYATKVKGEPEAERTSRCPRCGSDELIVLIEHDLAELRPQLEAKPTPAPRPAVVEASPPKEPASRRKLGPKGIAGVSLLGVGAAALVPGIALAVVGDKTRVDPGNSQYLQVTPLRTPGLVLVGVGAAAMIVGAVLLGIDQKRRRPKSARAGRVAVTGLALSVRW